MVASPTTHTPPKISIHALLAEGDSQAGQTAGIRPRISIHALLAEGDITPVIRIKKAGGISIHALLAEGDLAPRLLPQSKSRFLSTPSSRRATGEAARLRARGRDFYPRPPRGGRPNADILSDFLIAISIHALLAEGDYFVRTKRLVKLRFLSTPSSRRATPTKPHYFYVLSYFYPRPPRGGRPTSKAFLAQICLFLSTPSSRRATSQPTSRSTNRPISIHALLAEGDHGHAAAPGNFNISIHALLAEGDRPLRHLTTGVKNFYPRPPRGGRPRIQKNRHWILNHFYPRPPRGGRRR